MKTPQPYSISTRISSDLGRGFIRSYAKDVFGSTRVVIALDNEVAAGMDSNHEVSIEEVWPETTTADLGEALQSVHTAMLKSVKAISVNSPHAYRLAITGFNDDIDLDNAYTLLENSIEIHDPVKTPRSIFVTVNTGDSPEEAQQFVQKLLTSGGMSVSSQLKIKTWGRRITALNLEDIVDKVRSSVSRNLSPEQLNQVGDIYGKVRSLYGSGMTNATEIAGDIVREVTNKPLASTAKKEASLKKAYSKENGYTDEEVLEKAFEMFKCHWHELSSSQQDEVVKALDKEFGVKTAAVKSLEELREGIEDVLSEGKKEYSHNIISSYLREIAQLYGDDEANSAIEDLALDQLGFATKTATGSTSEFPIAFVEAMDEIYEILVSSVFGSEPADIEVEYATAIKVFNKSEVDPDSSEFLGPWIDIFTTDTTKFDDILVEIFREGNVPTAIKSFPLSQVSDVVNYVLEQAKRIGLIRKAASTKVKAVHNLVCEECGEAYKDNLDLRRIPGLCLACSIAADLEYKEKRKKASEGSLSPEALKVVNWIDRNRRRLDGKLMREVGNEAISAGFDALVVEEVLHWLTSTGSTKTSSSEGLELNRTIDKLIQKLHETTDYGQKAEILEDLAKAKNELATWVRDGDTFKTADDLSQKPQVELNPNEKLVMDKMQNKWKAVPKETPTTEVVGESKQATDTWLDAANEGREELLGYTPEFLFKWVEEQHPEDAGLDIEHLEEKYKEEFLKHLWDTREGQVKTAEPSISIFVEGPNGDEEREIVISNWEISPAEKRTYDYPGCPASVDGFKAHWKEGDKELTGKEWETYIEPRESEIVEQIFESYGDEREASVKTAGETYILDEMIEDAYTHRSPQCDYGHQLQAQRIAKEIIDSRAVTPRLRTQIEAIGNEFNLRQYVEEYLDDHCLDGIQASAAPAKERPESFCMDCGNYPCKCPRRQAKKASPEDEDFEYCANCGRPVDPVKPHDCFDSRAQASINFKPGDKVRWRDEIEGNVYPEVWGTIVSIDNGIATVNVETFIPGEANPFTPIEEKVPVDMLQLDTRVSANPQNLQEGDIVLLRGEDTLESYEVQSIRGSRVEIQDFRGRVTVVPIEHLYLPKLKTSKKASINFQSLKVGDTFPVDGVQDKIATVVSISDFAVTAYYDGNMHDIPFNSSPNKEEETISCPVDCPGCSCHITAPCGHCVDHTQPEM